MKLLSIALSNFKGVKDRTESLNGENHTFTGENGTGKTTFLDGFLWVVGGTDSTGRVERGKGGFDIRPHDKDRVPIPGVTVSVKAKIKLANLSIVDLEKQHVENRTKDGDVTGFTTLHSVNGEPMQEKAYKKYIESILPKKVFKSPTETFKMLTNLAYFNSDKVHHSDRRKLLLSMAGEIIEPSGFDDMLGRKADMSMDGYIAKLKLEMNGNGSVDGYKKEAKGIPALINENQQSLDSYSADGDAADIEALRDAKQVEIENLQALRKGVTLTESDRNKEIEALQKLEGEKINRESFLENDTSSVQRYIDEKHNIAVGLGKIKLNISGEKQGIERVTATIKRGNAALELAMEKRSEAIAAIKILEDPENKNNACPKCGHDLDETHKTNEIAKHDVIGDAANTEVKEIKTELERLAGELAVINESLEQLNIQLQEAQTARTERFEIIDSILNERVGIAPSDDPEWVEICSNINIAKANIGDPVSDQLAAIDENMAACNKELVEINKSLNNFDNAEKTRARIEEHKAREVFLGQEIARVKGELATIDEYKTAQNNIISKSVDKLFKHVTFQMFKKNIADDGVSDDCTAIFTKEGTLYPDCSTGEKVSVNLDCINTLSKYFGVVAPLFVDNAESFTDPIEYDGQVIRLVAKDGVDVMTVERTV